MKCSFYENFINKFALVLAITENKMKKLCLIQMFMISEIKNFITQHFLILRLDSKIVLHTLSCIRRPDPCTFDWQ